jgi:peptidoglycan/LPS O-acetylase OafA/YrhL
MTALSKPFSVYLDLVRFVAACLVYVWHSNQRWIVESPLPASNYGHSSVVVFFVLSGFVIAFITQTKERDWPSYAASRLSRIYSVAIPALALTILLDTIGRHLYPPAYRFPYDSFALRTGASLLMANEIWFVSITPFSNVPYWSICYEAWYYVAFGILSFARAPIAMKLVCVVAFVVGPKIVLLAPIWAMGVALYRSRSLAGVTESLGWLLALASAAGIAMFHGLGIDHSMGAWLELQLGKAQTRELAFSNNFIADNLLGLLVTLHLAGVRAIAPRLAGPLLAIERPVKVLASYTFTLYLLHQPLLLFWGAVLRGNPVTAANWFAITGLVALSVAAIGGVTETRRYLLTAWIRRILLAVSAGRRPKTI